MTDRENLQRALAIAYEMLAWVDSPKFIVERFRAGLRAVVTDAGFPEPAYKSEHAPLSDAELTEIAARGSQ